MGEERVSVKVSRWTRALKLLQQAIRTAAPKHGFPIVLGGLGTVEVVPLTEVRKAFFDVYPIADPTATAEQKENTRQHAFRRALKDATAKGLVGNRQHDGGEIIWIAK